jgi:hypothetical protein
MIWFQSTTASFAGLEQAQFHDSVGSIIVEICHNSSLSKLLPRCKTLPVAFLPQVLRARVGFWAKQAHVSIPCHS